MADYLIFLHYMTQPSCDDHIVLKTCQKNFSHVLGPHVPHRNLTSEKWQGILFYGGISPFSRGIFWLPEVSSILLQISAGPYMG
jgi:hypothetical protein